MSCCESLPPRRVGGQYVSACLGISRRGPRLPLALLCCSCNPVLQLELNSPYRSPYQHPLHSAQSHYFRRKVTIILSSTFRTFARYKWVVKSPTLKCCYQVLTSDATTGHESVSLMLGPRIPLEIQEHIIEFLESEMTWPNELDPFDNTIIPGLSYHVALRMERCQSLASCSLVCRAWVLSSQKILFSWVCLREAHRLDKFRLMLEAPCSSHLSHYIHRISLVYAPPCYKLGEVIPRLADMELPNLKYLDMACAGNVTPTTITQFPFHRSLVLHALRLQNILHLYLENFQFTHLVELRRLIGIFSGATCFTHLDLRCGNDRLDDFRLFRHATNQRLCKVDPLMAEMGLFRKLNATIWLAGISRTPPRNRTETIKEVSPLLDLDLARFFADIQTKLPVIGTSWWSFDDSHHNCMFHVFNLCHEITSDLCYDLHRVPNHCHRVARVQIVSQFRSG